jgi:hypothetical protein
MGAGTAKPLMDDLQVALQVGIGSSTVSSVARVWRELKRDLVRVAARAVSIFVLHFFLQLTGLASMPSGTLPAS